MHETVPPSVLITGAGSGLGREAALAFAGAGYHVIATGRRRRPLRDLELAAAGAQLSLETLVLDTTRTETFAQKLDRATRTTGRLDVVVLCAGLHRGGALETLPEEDLRSVMETNFFGPLALARAALPRMRDQGGGRILAISSLSGLAAPACDGAYAASKHALEGAFEALSQEVARWAIHVALVHFGAIATNLLRCSGEGPANGRYADLEAVLERARDAVTAPPSPATIARQLPAIAAALPGPLRWACDATAERVFTSLGTDRQAERRTLLNSVAETDWWRNGLSPPSVHTE